MEVRNDGDLCARNMCVVLYEDHLGHEENICLMEILGNNGDRIIVAHGDRWCHNQLKTLLLGLQLVWVVMRMILCDHGTSGELNTKKIWEDDLEAQFGSPHLSTKFHRGNNHDTKITTSFCLGAAFIHQRAKHISKTLGVVNECIITE